MIIFQCSGISDFLLLFHFLNPRYLQLHDQYSSSIFHVCLGSKHTCILHMSYNMKLQETVDRPCTSSPVSLYPRPATEEECLLEVLIYHHQTLQFPGGTLDMTTSQLCPGIGRAAPNRRYKMCAYTKEVWAWSSVRSKKNTPTIPPLQHHPYLP